MMLVRLNDIYKHYTWESMFILAYCLVIKRIISKTFNLSRLIFPHFSSLITKPISVWVTMVANHRDKQCITESCQSLVYGMLMQSLRASITY